jgi:membrane protease YdiL (CAAX protease family)
MKSTGILIETLIVLALTLGGIIFLPQAKSLFAFLPVIYLLVERKVRRRSWAEIGFKFNTFWDDLRANWGLVLLVGAIVQLAVIFWARAFFPEFLAHVAGRLPVSASALLRILPILAILLLGEELSFRSLFQGRLMPFLGIPLAILLSSLAFGFAHFTPGPVNVVAIDIGLIMLDSFIFGVIYMRSNNVLVSWLAHFIGDVVALLLMISI